MRMCHYNLRRAYPCFQAQQLPPPPIRLATPPPFASKLDRTCDPHSHAATVSCAGAVSSVRRRFPNPLCRRRAPGTNSGSLDMPVANRCGDNAGMRAPAKKWAAAVRPRHDSQCGGGNASGSAVAAPETTHRSPAPLQLPDALVISVARRPAERTRRCGGAWRR